MEKVTLRDLVGDKMEESFLDFDLTEIHEVLERLQSIDAIDLAHAELLQQQSLRGADIISDYIGKIVKTVIFLETKMNRAKNKAALNYTAPSGRTTSDMKKWFSESCPEVEELQIKLAKAKGSKLLLEKKYDILIRQHHHYKDIATGLRKTILGYSVQKEKVPQGYE